jgi:hypothetical protein
MGLLPHLEISDTHFIFHQSGQKHYKFERKDHETQIDDASICVSHQARLIQFRQAYFVVENNYPKKILFNDYLKFRVKFAIDGVINVQQAMNESKLTEFILWFAVVVNLTCLFVLVSGFNVLNQTEKVILWFGFCLSYATPFLLFAS